MYIVFGAREHAVWGHRNWTMAKRRAYHRLKADTIALVAQSIGKGEQPDPIVFVRHPRRSKANSNGAPRYWLMASKVKRGGDTFHVSAYYFGPDRDFVSPNLSPADITHSETVDRTRFELHYEGDSLVISPVDDDDDDDSEQIDPPDGPDDDTMIKAFISYRREDRSWARRIEAFLALRSDIFVDQGLARPRGEDDRRQIQHRIAQCTAQLVVANLGRSPETDLSVSAGIPSIHTVEIDTKRYSSIETTIMWDRRAVSIATPWHHAASAQTQNDRAFEKNASFFLRNERADNANASTAEFDAGASREIETRSSGRAGTARAITLRAPDAHSDRQGIEYLRYSMHAQHLRERIPGLSQGATWGTGSPILFGKDLQSPASGTILDHSTFPAKLIVSRPRSQIESERNT